MSNMILILDNDEVRPAALVRPGARVRRARTSTCTASPPDPPTPCLASQAVAYFSGNGLGLSATVQAALGGSGRHAEGGMRLDLASGTVLTNRYCYGHSSGVFAGMGMQGLLLLPRMRENREYYGPGAGSMADVLRGEVGLAPKPAEVARLHAIIEQAAHGGNPWTNAPGSPAVKEELSIFVSGRARGRGLGPQSVRPVCAAAGRRARRCQPNPTQPNPGVHPRRALRLGGRLPRRQPAGHARRLPGGGHPARRPVRPSAAPPRPQAGAARGA